MGKGTGMKKDVLYLENAGSGKGYAKIELPRSSPLLVTKKAYNPRNPEDRKTLVELTVQIPEVTDSINNVLAEMGIEEIY